MNFKCIIKKLKKFNRLQKVDKSPILAYHLL
jgi:hypothetical protein